MQVVYGVHPVAETLKNGGEIEKIFLARGEKRAGIRKIMDLATQRKTPVTFTDREHLNTLAGNRHHQGVVCICEEYRHTDIDTILAGCASKQDPLVLILDGITDPQNLGSLIRTAFCFGVSGLIIPTDRAASITPSVIKASAGAALHLPVARVVNIARIIDQLKEEGFWIYGTAAASERDISSPDYSGRVALVLGSEGKGIRPLVRKKCDMLVTIPMTGALDSLNVSVAGGICLYEITRCIKTRAMQEERG